VSSRQFEELVSEEGGPTAFWKKVVKRMKGDLQSAFSDVQSYLDEKRRKQEEADLIAYGHSSAAKQAALMREKLSQMATGGGAAKPVNSSNVAKAFRTKQTFVEFYEANWEAVTGLHSFGMHAGKAEFHCACHGLDFVQLFPDPAEFRPHES
jgi:hypothetical protein